MPKPQPQPEPVDVLAANEATNGLRALDGYLQPPPFEQPPPNSPVAQPGEGDK